jgi:hypothetical protein
LDAGREVERYLDRLLFRSEVGAIFLCDLIIPMVIILWVKPWLTDIFLSARIAVLLQAIIA